MSSPASVTCTVARVTTKRTHSPITGAALTLDPAASYDHPVPADHRLLAHVLSGAVRVAGRPVREGQAAWVDPVGRGSGSESTCLPVVAADRRVQARVMLYSGRPLREPVFLGGPFVMSSRREVEQAHRDFQTGRFGEVPRQARLKYVR